MFSFDEMKSKEITKAIRENVSILDYAVSIGQSLVREGRYYSLADHDSVKINPVTNQFKQYSVDPAGKGHPWLSVIDFAIRFDNSVSNTAEAIEKLKQLVDFPSWKNTSTPKRKTVHKEKENNSVELPERSLSTKHIYAYLTKTRGISPSVVNKMIEQGNLYEDTKNNCVFVGYDSNGNVNFGCKRGTNTYGKAFKGDCAGNDYEHCIYIDNGADTLIVSEAFIDSMSNMTILEESGKNILNYNYNILAGADKWGAVVNNLKEHPKNKKVLLALDADDKGFYGASNIIRDIEQEDMSVEIIYWLPEQCHDWNEQLIFNKENNISTSEYNKMQTFYTNNSLLQEQEEELLPELQGGVV